MKIPPFVNIAHDETMRKASLSIEDSSIGEQRAMWGMYFNHFPAFERI